MLSFPLSRRRAAVWAFALAFGLALAFALFTDHVWEDYYITYRSSKNLATGHGLVFNHGDRLHTFTSPLGVLLPAVASLLTANSSDTAALWIFRLMCLSAIGGAAALLLAVARRLALPALAAGFVVLAVATDAKSLDFAINGMETAFMLLFLAYALWAHLAPGPRQWLHLGAAWAGLMWTRPDSFIYIGLVGAAVWLFNDPARTGATRRGLLALYFKAALVTTALYGPWLAWAHGYYGTAVPHTIVAKGAQSGGFSAGKRFLENFWQLPWKIWQGASAADGAFLPSYFGLGPWPGWAQPFARALATIASVAWLLPRVRFETRAASFAFFFAAAYLSYVPYFPFPWYFPSTFLLAAVALGGLAAQGAAHSVRLVRGFTAAAVALVLVAGIALTWGTARQMRAQQIYVETGNRRVIGEWLQQHAAPGDSVFMEPLGYIGFFSGLKTYDWPGMSSREVVEARFLVGPLWRELICYLEPTWLVLRTNGDGDLSYVSSDLNATNYEAVRDFSRLDEILKLDVPGRRLLEFDGAFRLYRRKQPTRHDVDGLAIAAPFPSSIRNIGPVRVRLVHAPGSMLLEVPAGRRRVRGQFGFPPEVVTTPPGTDGAKFRIAWTDGTCREELLVRFLDPVKKPDDRGLQSYELALPTPRPGRKAFLDFATDPVASSTMDWTCWSDPVLEP